MKDRYTLLLRLFVLRLGVTLSLVVYVLNSYELGAHPWGIESIFSILALLCVSIIFSWLRHRRERLVSDLTLALQLACDAAIILIVAYSFGRSTNPFMYYLLVIIALSAGLFKEKWVWLICASGVIAYTQMMYLDSSKHFLHLSSDFKSHLIGMWVNFVLSAVLLAFFISKLTAALRRRERALARAREDNLKNEQLVGLGTLATATVHSFGTPLSTIILLADEIQAKHAHDKQTHDDTEAIKAQIARCKKTMSHLTNVAGFKSSELTHIAIAELINSVQEHYEIVHSNPMPEFQLSVEESNLEFVPGGVLLLHAVINLVDNAVRAANSHVLVKCSTTKDQLLIEIQDDGCGIDPALLDDLGDVIVDGQSGMGLGVMLSNSTINRFHGRVHFTNPSEDIPYTRVLVELPLSRESL
jgi:two-component system sensor histidine kinase RegB